jgi:hypothetical protein
MRFTLASPRVFVALIATTHHHDAMAHFLFKFSFHPQFLGIITSVIYL